jgi:hypothetical protein
MARNPTWLGGKPETKKPTENSRLWKLVDRGGIEPPTQRFSINAEVIRAVKRWKEVAASADVGMTTNELETFKPAFEPAFKQAL